MKTVNLQPDRKPETECCPLNAESPLPAVSRILLLRGGALGDFVLTLPVLDALRARWPLARLELAAYPAVGRLAVAAGLADRAWSLDDAACARLFSTCDESVALPAEWGACDLAISFLHDPSGAVAHHLRAAGIRHVEVASPMVDQGHAADMLTRPLAAIGLQVPQPALPRLRVPSAIGAAATARLRNTTSRKCVTLHPGSGSARKNWPLRHFVALARLLGETGAWQPVFLLGPVEKGLDASLRQLAPEIPIIHGGELAEVAGLLSAAALHIGNDAGITHLAGAVGVPVLALFGPTDPTQWGPRGPNILVIRADPPTTEGLAALTPETVFRHVQRTD